VPAEVSITRSESSRADVNRTDERGQEPVWPAILPERYATQSLARSNDAAVSSSGCKRAPPISQGCVFCARRDTSQRLPRVLSAAEAFRSAAVQDAYLCRALLASAAPYSSKRQSPVRPNFPLLDERRESAKRLRCRLVHRPDALDRDRYAPSANGAASHRPRVIQLLERLVFPPPMSMPNFVALTTRSRMPRAFSHLPIMI
jgi:hypothetical protein